MTSKTPAFGYFSAQNRTNVFAFFIVLSLVLPVSLSAYAKSEAVESGPSSANAPKMEYQLAGSQVVFRTSEEQEGEYLVYEDGVKLSTFFLQGNQRSYILNQRVTGHLSVELVSEGRRETLKLEPTRDFLWFENISMGQVVADGLSATQRLRLRFLALGLQPSAGGSWSSGPENLTKFICTGIYSEGGSLREKIEARKKAKNVCSYAEGSAPVDRQTSYWFQTKATSAPSYVGRVLITVKGPESFITDSLGSTQRPPGMNSGNESEESEPEPEVIEAPAFIAAPEIIGDASAGSEVMLDKGEWKGFNTDWNAALWFACDEHRDSMTFSPGRLEDLDTAGCQLVRSGSRSQELPGRFSETWSGAVSLRVAFELLNEDFLPEMTVTLSERILWPSSKLSVSILETSREVTGPDRQQVIISYRVKNENSAPIREVAPRVVDDSGLHYAPVRYVAYESQMMPPGAEVERQAVIQIDGMLDSQLRYGFYREELTDLPNLKNKEISLVKGLAVEVEERPFGEINFISWDPVTTYSDGTPLISEGSIRYYIEITEPGQQSQRRYYSEPELYIRAPNGATFDLWVLGSQSVSEKLSFSLSFGQIFFD